MSEQERREHRERQKDEMTEMWSSGDEFARGWYESKMDTIYQMARKAGVLNENKSARPA